MEIREAQPEDAAAICAVLYESVMALCVGDHGNDPAILDAWLGHKTPELLRQWIEDPSGTILVAEDGTKMLAVGGVKKSGEITLNYIRPAARLRGISKQMLCALEAQARARGATTCFFNSTGTARRFYLAMGYEEQASKTGLFGTTVYPMSKAL